MSSSSAIQVRRPAAVRAIPACFHIASRTQSAATWAALQEGQSHGWAPWNQFDDRAVGMIGNSLNYAAGIKTPENEAFVNAFAKAYKRERPATVYQRALVRRANLPNVPRWLARSLVTLTSWMKRPPLTKTAFALMAHEVTVDDSKARRELGYTGKKTIADGLAERALELVGKLRSVLLLHVVKEQHLSTERERRV